jgi:hypothetical protein
MDWMMLMKFYLRGPLALIFFSVLFPEMGLAQRFEFGAGVGILNYKGDLNPQINPLLSKPGLQFIGRYNFSMAVVARANLVFGNLAGKGSLSPDLYISSVQPNSFSTPLIEFSGLIEYNFFNYRNPKNRFIFGSPYLFGGPSVFVFSPTFVEKGGNASPVQSAIILGFGYKHQISQFWNIGAEFGARFCFTDYLDNVSDQELVTKFQRGNLYDKDIYTFFGINLTYTIKEIICPFDYQQSDDKK